MEEVSRLRGGFDCAFVNPPTELQDECSICLSILRDPYLVNCCGYSFCYTCIQPIISDRKPCPLCKKRPFEIMPDKRLQRNLGQRDVYCSKKDLGCDWVGILLEIDNHLNMDPIPASRLFGCHFIQLMCLHCRSSFKRGELKGHEDNCPQKPHTCEYCHDFTATRNVVRIDHFPNCKHFPLKCSNECGEVFARWKMESHLVNDCPFTAVNCDYHYAGCDTWLMRKDLPGHMIRNAAKHAAHLAEENRALIIDVHRLQDRLAHYQKELSDTMADCKVISDDNISLFRELKERSLRDDCELENLIQDVKEKDSELKTLKIRLGTEEAASKEMDTLLQVQEKQFCEMNELFEEKDSILKVRELELNEARSQKQSLLKDISKRETLLKSELEEKQQQLEVMSKKLEEKDALEAKVSKQQEEIANLRLTIENIHELELQNKDKLIAKQKKMIEKLRSTSDKPHTKMLESDTSAENNWPEFEFDPYDESPDVSDASPFVPYTTYAERNKTSTPTRTVSSASLSSEATNSFTDLPAAKPLRTASTPLTSMVYQRSVQKSSQLETQNLQQPPPPPPPAQPTTVMNFKAALTKTLSKPPCATSSNPKAAASIAKLNSSGTSSLGARPFPLRPSSDYKLMIRNTPSRKRGVTDGDIVELFGRFGRVISIDRKGSNTAVVFADQSSFHRAITHSKSNKGIICGGVKLNCFEYK